MKLLPPCVRRMGRKMVPRAQDIILIAQRTAGHQRRVGS